VQARGNAIPGKIGPRSLKGTVNSVKWMMAQGTESLIAFGGDDHDESVRVRSEEVQTQAGWVRKNGGSADDRKPR